MEAITRIVADSLARHGLDRPIDPHRLQWSRWSRCDSPHSLLVVPSKPGIFALAEEIMDLGHGDTLEASTTHVDREGHDFSSEPALSERSEPKGAVTSARNSPASAAEVPLGGAPLQRCDSAPLKNATSAPEVPQRRMLAVLQFSEDDDMAFTLDRMFTCVNPMRTRFASGRCFLRFVVIEDGSQRRSICSALNQWLINSAEKASGLPPDFQSSLELTTDRIGADRVGRTLLSDSVVSIPKPAQAQPIPKPDSINPALYPDSGANKNLHCPHPLPSGF